MVSSAQLHELRRPTPLSSPALVAFLHARLDSERLCADLGPEDCQVQSAPNCSPLKWHLAHTSWFYEHFILRRYLKSFLPDDLYHYLYNSYYHTVGAMTPRAQRGLITRPSLDKVYACRAQVDEAMTALLSERGDDQQLLFLTRLGIEHERQHQELMLMDIKHHFFFNPSYPTYRDNLPTPPQAKVSDMVYIGAEPGLVQMGREPIRSDSVDTSFADSNGFCFDNETPRHDAILPAFEIANRPVSNGEYLNFIEDDGYQRVELWLADAWEWVQTLPAPAPLYWLRRDNRWMMMTLSGLRPVRADLPVCHLSYYEACAYAQWAGKRLPSEYELEWMLSLECADSSCQLADANFMESGYLSPLMEERFCGNLWEWTRSAYSPYPGFKPLPGSIGEYNGKFMVNQYVLRGGSCITPRAHFHPSRRNFFYPHERWAFTGLRLAADI